jgi:hypothetical protein
MEKKASILSAGIALACAACLPVVGAVAAITGIAAKVLGVIPSAGIGFLDKIKLFFMAILGKMVIGASRDIDMLIKNESLQRIADNISLGILRYLSNPDLFNFKYPMSQDNYLA